MHALSFQIHRSSKATICKYAFKECLSLEGSKLGLQSRLAEQETSIAQLKQSLLRTTLAKQTVESEKNELERRIDELLAENMENDLMGISRSGSVDRSLYSEELAVARDAISNLRSSFPDSDPNQHILDTLEQCISVIVEKLSCPLANGDKMSRIMNQSQDNAGGYITTSFYCFGCY